MLLNFIKIRFHGSMPKIMRISHPIVIYKMQILLSWHTAMSHLLLGHIPIYRTSGFPANLVHFMLGVVVQFLFIHTVTRSLQILFLLYIKIPYNNILHGVKLLLDDYLVHFLFFLLLFPF